MKRIVLVILVLGFMFGVVVPQVFAGKVKTLSITSVTNAKIISTKRVYPNKNVFKVTWKPHCDFCGTTQNSKRIVNAEGWSSFSTSFTCSKCLVKKNEKHVRKVSIKWKSK